MKIKGYELRVMRFDKTFGTFFYNTLWGAKRSPYRLYGRKSYIAPVYEDHTAPIKYLMCPFTYNWTRLY